MNYPIVDVFRSLQGEGHFVGYPTVFVRLAGCSVVGCHIRAECDEAPWKATKEWSVLRIVDAVREAQTGGIVCITGGEPTDHELTPLVCELHREGFRVHLETSGVRSVLGMPLEWLTVSPKVFSREGLQQRVGHALKVVVHPEWSNEKAWSLLRELEATTSFFHRYLQPLTVRGRPANLKQVTTMLLDPSNVEWAMSVQAHRYWSLP